MSEGPAALEDFRRAFLGRFRDSAPFQAFLRRGLTAEQSEAMRQWAIQEVAQTQCDYESVHEDEPRLRLGETRQDYFNNRVKATPTPDYPDGQKAGYTIEGAPESLWPGWHAPESRGTGRQRDERSAVKIIYSDGTEDWTKLGNDEAAITSFLVEAARATGYELEELARPPQRGRPSAEGRARLDTLARVVNGAIRRGATEEAIGAVIGRSKQRVSELKQRAA